MILRTLLAFALLVGPAFGQVVTGPQTVNPPNVVSGADSSGNFTQRQVQYTDLAFPALFGLNTTASNQVTVGLGDQVFYLDYDPGFQQGYTVQIISTIDPQAWMAGRISVYTNSGGQTQITVSVTQDQGDSFTGSGWYLQIVSSDAAFIPVTGVSLSSLTFGTGAGQISQGGVVSLGTESGLLLNNSHVVVVAIGSPTNYFRGISQYNSTTGALTIYTTDSSGSGTFTAWSLFAQDGPPVNANQIAVSQSNATIGSGIIPFTIQAGQNFPIQGPITITALSATTNQMLGTIYAYNGTTLSAQVPSTGTYGSGNFGSWSILNTGPPQTRISLYQMNGLQMGGLNTSTLTVNAGSIRDSTDTIDLILSSPTTLSFALGSSKVVSTQGPGTVAISTFVVTGTGTNFTTFFNAASTLTDLNNQLTALNLSTLTFGSIFTDVTDGLTATTTTVVNNTQLDLNGSPFGTVTNDNYYRGGIQAFNQVSSAAAYGIYLAYQTSTGSTGLFATSFTPNGNPDLPSGYSYYRIIGYVMLIKGNLISVIGQPLASNVLTTAGDILYEGQNTSVFSIMYPTYLQRLPIGSSGNVLEVNSGLPAWGSLGALSQLGVGTGLQSSGGNLNVNLSLAFSKLTADVLLNNTGTFFDGPSMAQGNAGVWWVTGTVTVGDTAAGTANSSINCKLWDGTTVYASSANFETANLTTTTHANSITLAGILSALTGNIRISCNDITSVNGKIKANLTGNGADSTIWGIRIQ